MNEGYISVLKDMSADSPTPGGGAVAALTLGHAYSLTSMVSRLTIGRDKWIEGHEISEKLISLCDQGLEQSIQMAKDDCESFEEVMASYKLPRNNEEEIMIRKESIINSSLRATMAPFTIAQKALDLLILLPNLAKYGNANALTDLASASQLTQSAIYVASLNVKINISSISDKDAANFSRDIKEILSQGNSKNEEIQKIIFSRLSW